ncbi:uncharacterized protein LOC113789812 [Dermatophagoides pteronyssinus]|uniref:uncharacterized protein LOC113789812 n=1 Tax=Dermatophagoides pteronyssinus TaxID=6956 RepID=UPI003F6814E1
MVNVLVIGDGVTVGSTKSMSTSSSNTTTTTTMTANTPTTFTNCDDENKTIQQPTTTIKSIQPVISSATSSLTTTTTIKTNATTINNSQRFNATDVITNRNDGRNHQNNNYTNNNRLASTTISTNNSVSLQSSYSCGKNHHHHHTSSTANINNASVDTNHKNGGDGGGRGSDTDTNHHHRHSSASVAGGNNTGITFRPTNYILLNKLRVQSSSSRIRRSSSSSSSSATNIDPLNAIVTVGSSSSSSSLNGQNKSSSSNVNKLSTSTLSDRRDYLGHNSNHHSQTNQLHQQQHPHHLYQQHQHQHHNHQTQHGQSSSHKTTFSTLANINKKISNNNVIESPISISTTKMMTTAEQKTTMVPSSSSSSSSSSNGHHSHSNFHKQQQRLSTSTITTTTTTTTTSASTSTSSSIVMVGGGNVGSSSPLNHHHINHLHQHLRSSVSTTFNGSNNFPNTSTITMTTRPIITRVNAPYWLNQQPNNKKDCSSSSSSSTPTTSIHEYRKNSALLNEKNRSLLINNGNVINRSTSTGKSTAIVDDDLVQSKVTPSSSSSTISVTKSEQKNSKPIRSISTIINNHSYRINDSTRSAADLSTRKTKMMINSNSDQSLSISKKQLSSLHMQQQQQQQRIDRIDTDKSMMNNVDLVNNNNNDKKINNDDDDDDKNNVSRSVIVDDDDDNNNNNNHYHTEEKQKCDTNTRVKSKTLIITNDIDGNTNNNNNNNNGDIVIDVDNDDDNKSVTPESGHNINDVYADVQSPSSSSSSSNDKIKTTRSDNNDSQMKQLLKFIEKSSPEMLFLLEKSAQLSYQMALFERKLDYLKKIFTNENKNNNNCTEENNESLLWSKVINRTRAWIADCRKKNIFLTNYELKPLVNKKSKIISEEQILDEWKTLVAKNNKERKPMKMFNVDSLATMNEQNVIDAAETNESSSYVSLSSKDELIMLLDQIAQFSSNIIYQSRKNQSNNFYENNNLKQDNENDDIVDLNRSARDGTAINAVNDDDNDDSLIRNQKINEKQNGSIHDNNNNHTQSIMKDEIDPKSFLHRLLTNNRMNNDENEQNRENEQLLEQLKPDILKALVQIIKTNSLLVQVQREFDILMCAHLKSYSRSLSKQQQQQQQGAHRQRHNEVNQFILGTSPSLSSSMPFSYNGGGDHHQHQLLAKRIKSNSPNQHKLRAQQQQQQSQNFVINNNGNKSMTASHHNYNFCNNPNQILNQKFSQTQQTNRMMNDELSQYVGGDCCMGNKLSQNNNFVSDGDSGGEFTATTVTNEFNQCITDDELSSLLNQIALCSQKIIEQSGSITGTNLTNTTNSSSNNSTSSSGCCCSTSIEAKCCSINNHNHNHHHHHHQSTQQLPITPSTLALRSQHHRQIGKDPLSTYNDQMMMNPQEISMNKYYCMNPTGSVQDLARYHMNYSSPIKTNANSMSFNHLNHHHHHHNHLLNHHDDNNLDSHQQIFNDSMKKFDNCYSSPSSKRILHEQYLGWPLDGPLFDRVSNNMTGFMLSSPRFDMMSPLVDQNHQHYMARHRTNIGQQHYFHHPDHRQSDGPCMNGQINDCINPTSAFIFDPNVDVESFLMEVEKELDENRFTSAPPFMNPVSSASNFDNGTPTHHNKNGYNSRSSNHHYRCSSMNRSSILRDEPSFCCQRTSTMQQSSSSQLPMAEQLKCGPGLASYSSPLVTNNVVCNATSTMHSPLMNSIHLDRQKHYNQRNHFNHNNNNNNHHHINCSNARCLDHQSLILAGGNWKLSQRNSINDFGRFNISLNNLSNNQMNGHQHHFPSTIQSSMTNGHSIPQLSSLSSSTAMMKDQTKFSYDLLDEYRTQVSYRVNEETDRQLKEIDQWLYKHLDQSQQQQQQSPNLINKNNNNSSHLHLNQEIGSVQQQQQQKSITMSTTDLAKDTFH